MNEGKETMKPEDPRTIRSKRDLANALFELLQEKNVADITVQDITDRALVSKTTFYNNFKDKEELMIFLLRRSAETLFGQVEDYLDEHKSLSSDELFYGTIHLVVDFLVEASTPFRQVIAHDASRVLYWSLTSILENVFRTCLEGEMRSFLNANLDADVAVYYFAGAFANLIYKKMSEEGEVDVQRLVEEVFQLSKPVIPQG